MTDSSRTINHKLNDILSKNNVSKNKLDSGTALNYATILKTNILGKDKQEKVNSIVVLAKLLDCIISCGEGSSNEFTRILDHTLFKTLFMIVSPNMSTETYKAILKISVIHIRGGIFKSRDDDGTFGIENYLPLYESLVEYLDVLDIITQKLHLQDNKITYNSIKLVSDLINRALKYHYNDIITLAGRLKHVEFFSTVGSIFNTEDKLITEAIDGLKVAYFNLNEFLAKTRFDLSIKSHQVMLNNLFIYLEVSLNEFGAVATTEEYVKAGLTEDPKKFVVDNFTILLAMDFKIFLKSPNFTFKKRFHEELMMSNHNRTFPVYLFIESMTNMWLDIFHHKETYPNIFENILLWEYMIYYSMNTCLVLWQQTRARIEGRAGEIILTLIKSQIPEIEAALSERSLSIEDCLDLTKTQTVEELRHKQISILKEEHEQRWKSQFIEFNKYLREEVMDFVCEQRVVQLLKGSWVYTERYGEQLFNVNSMTNLKSSIYNKYYFIVLSPNRKYIYFKEFPEKASINPSYEEMETRSIRILDITEFKSVKVNGSPKRSERNGGSLLEVKGTISYEKITLYGEGNRKLISFYTDTEVSKYVWLDGLKMLRGMINPGQLSEETEKQLQTLEEIRRNAQLLALEGDEFGGEVKFDNNLLKELDQDEDEYYDMDELVSITCDGFYYK